TSLLGGPTRLMLITLGARLDSQPSALTIAVAEPAAPVPAIDVRDEQLRPLCGAMKGTLAPHQQRSDGRAVPGRLWGAGEAVLLNAFPYKRRMRRDAPIDHADRSSRAPHL